MYPRLVTRGHLVAGARGVPEQIQASRGLAGVGQEISGAGQPQVESRGVGHLGAIFSRRLVIALHHVESGERQPSLRISRVLTQRLVQQYSCIVELVPVLQYGCLRQQGAGRRQRLRHPGCNDGFGVTREVRIADLPAIIDVRVRELDGRRQALRLGSKLSAQALHARNRRVGDGRDLL